MADKLTIAQKRKLAEEIYFGSGLNLKEVAERVDVTQKTIGAWAKEGQWEVLRTSASQMNAKLVAQAYKQLAAMNAAIEARPETERFPTPSESQTMAQIRGTLEALNKKMNLAHYHEVMEEFIIELKNHDLALAQKVVEYQKVFMHKKAKAISGI